VSEPAQRDRNQLLMQRATYAAVAAAALLVAGKFVVWIMSGSVSVLASLIDSLLDAAASLVNLIAVRHALMPPDREHRFGHGKAEPLAGLAQSAFIAGSAVLLLVKAAERLLAPVPVAHTNLAVAVMALSMLVTVALVAFQRHVIARTNSTAIRADSLHYAGDLMVGIGTIVALLLARWLEAPIFDPLFGGAVALFIVYSAWQIVAQSLDMLMDRELSDEDRRRIREACMAHPGVQDVHDLKTRAAGQDIFIQAHLEIDGTMRLTEAHAITVDVEARLKKIFPAAEIILHQDPAGVTEPRSDLAGIA